LILQEKTLMQHRGTRVAQWAGITSMRLEVAKDREKVWSMKELREGLFLPE